MTTNSESRKNLNDILLSLGILTMLAMAVLTASDTNRFMYWTKTAFVVAFLFSVAISLWKIK